MAPLVYLLGFAGVAFLFIELAKPGTALATSAAVKQGEATPVPQGQIGGVLRSAITQIGVPYQWGGEAERVAFDCSGLVQWAARKSGITLPRTAQEQYNATQRVPAASVQPGDLVFFSNGSEISHVGIVVRPGVMLDAPHTGAKVRYESFPETVGAAWGSDHVAGYGRP